MQYFALIIKFLNVKLLNLYKLIQILDAISQYILHL